MLLFISDCSDAAPAQHDNITIEGNSEFTSDNGVSSGTGTPSDPFVIEDLVIVGTSSRGIRIRDTDAHIVIRNVTFSRENGYTSGLSLRNMTNCFVIDCTFDNLTYGLAASLSTSVSVKWCTFNGSTVRFAASNAVTLTASAIFDVSIGLEVTDVDGCIIDDCTFFNTTNKCCWVRGSVTNMTVVDNRFTDVDGYAFYTYTDPTPDHSLVFSRNFLTRCLYGVYIIGFDAVTVSDNRVEEDLERGIEVAGGSYLRCENNSIEHRGISVGFESIDNTSVVFDNNTVGGRPILLFMDRRDVEVPVDVGQVIVINCTGIDIDGIAFRDTRFTVSLALCVDVTVSNCTFLDTPFGIGLHRCEGVVVRNVTFAGGKIVVMMGSSNDVLLIDNRFNGSDTGIDLRACRDVTIQDNSFLDCTICVSRNSREEEDACYSVTIVGNEFTSSVVGCDVQNSDDVYVISNTFLDVASICVRVNMVSPLVVMDNWFTDCPSDAVDLQRCDGSQVRNNTFLQVSSAVAIGDSDDVNVTGNMMMGTDGHCLRFYRTTNANITRNHITGPSVPSLELYDCSEVTVHHNNLLSSGPVLVYDEGGDNISWDDGAEGNHWSDYRTRYPHANRTGGLWDVPYEIPGPTGSRDRFPRADIQDLHPPVADAGDDVIVDEGTEVSLDASGSFDDVGIISYNWTFVCNGSLEELVGISSGFVFLLPGEYVVNLRVTDSMGKNDTDSVTIMVIDVLDPVADAGMDRSSEVKEPFELDGTNSFDTGMITGFNWTIDLGNGTVHLEGAVVTYTFDSLGAFQVTLRVTDSAGHTGEDIVTITIVDTTGPYPMIQAVDAVDQGTTVTFDAFNSTDNVNITSFIWTFDHGGAHILLEGPSAEFTFEVAGAYMITLTVKDGSGNEAEANHQLMVRDVTPPNAAPGTDRSTPQGQEYSLRDFGSTDDTGVVGHTWSFVMNEEDVILQGEEVAYTFEEPGVVLVTLMVMDAAGNTDSASFNLSILDTEKPVATMVGDIWTRIGEEVILDGSASTDNVGVVNHTWRFLYRGEDTVLHGATVPFTFERRGEYAVTLTVRDAAGNEDVSTFTVTIKEEEPSDGNSYLWLVIGAVVILLVVVGVYLVMRRT